MKDITKAIVYAGIFAIPAIVLIISNSLFFPFITGKNFTFRIIVEVIFAGWIILALYEPYYRPRFSWIAFCFTTLLVVMFFANLLGVNPQASFWSNFERMEGYVTLVHTFLYMVVAGSVLRTEKVWDTFFVTTIGVAVILSLYAFAQLSGNIVINQGGWRLDGTLGNSAYMAIYMLFHVFITFYMLFRTKSVGMRYTYGALALLFIYLLVQTATRGTILGFVIGSFIMVSYIALFARDYPTVRKVAAGGLVTLVVLVSLFVAFKDSSFIQGNPYLQRIASISLKEASTRFDIWSMAFEGVKERPILGWGQSNYNYVFNKYYEPELHAGEAWFDRVHNIVMDWLIAGGVVGALTYFSILGSAVYYLFLRPLFRREDNAFSVVERGVLLGILAGYTIHNVFVFDNIVSYIFYGTILAYIHSRVAESVPSIEKWKVDTRIVEQVAIPVVGVLLFVGVYYVNVPGIQAAGDIIKAFTAKTPEGVIANFEIALGRDSFGKQEIREQMTQKVQSLLQDKSVPDEVKQKGKLRVEEELLKQIEENPDDARVEVFMSSFYRMTGNVDEAIKHLEVARKLSPQKQLIILEQGFAHLQRQDDATAARLFKEAYDLGPQFMDVRVLYAMAAMYNGDLVKVYELINTDEAKKAFALNQYATQATYAAKEYPLLIEMFNIRVEQNPTDPQERASLAYIMNESGDTAGAIEVLKKAGEDIPSFKAQAEEYMKSIVSTNLGVTSSVQAPVPTKK